MSGSTFEVQLLNLMSTAAGFERYGNGAKHVIRAMTTPTQEFIKVFERYYKDTGSDRIVLEDFMPCFAGWYPNKNAQELQLYAAFIKRVLDFRPESGVAERLRGQLVQYGMAYDLTQAVAKWQQGEEVDLFSTVSSAAAELDKFRQKGQRNEMDYSGFSKEILRQENHPGFLWGLNCLNRCLKPLSGVMGDSVIIAGRPDTGKTSFLLSQVAFMAPQMANVYEDGDDRHVIYFNNEGTNTAIFSRLVQATLGITDAEMLALAKMAGKGGADSLLMAKYIEKMGRIDRVKLFGTHEFKSHEEMRDIVRENNTGMIVTDMLDNVPWTGALTNGGQRNDQILEALYAWTRNLGIINAVPTLHSSQLSAVAEGVQYPNMSQLKDSKTGKQGACDVIVTWGTDPSKPDSRFIGTPKNKRRKTGGQQSPHAEVVFDAARCVIKEPI